MNKKIKHPWTALFIIFILAAVLSNYGVVDGSLMVFDIFAVIVLYKFLTFGK